MPNDEPEHRYLIALGASEYDDPGLLPLERVVDDVNRIVAFFTSESQGYQRVLAEEIGLNASAPAIRAAVTQWFTSPERRSADRVVFYFAGHGDTDLIFGYHYLYTKTSDPNAPSGTAIASQDLPVWFFEGKSHPQNLLVILDTCYSGKGGGQATAVAAGAKELIFDETSEGLWIIASARPRDEAAEGAFVDALLAVAEDPAWGDRSQEFIDPPAIIDAMNQWFKAHDLIQRVDPDVVAPRRSARFIRNIKYHPGQRGLVLIDEAHWDPKARGTESITEVGWYFTGRHAALRHLVEYLTGMHSDRRACLVTGGPGSGKSAVLARLVTCAHPETRKSMEDAGVLKDVPPEELVPPNSIDVVIHARGQSIDQVAAAIAKACSLTDSNPITVLKVLSTQEKPLRIIIDALDEAQKPDALDLELLRPLAELPVVRLVVSSRCPRKDRPPLGERAVVLDLDEKYFDETDIAEYVIRRLQRLDPATPYSHLNHDEIAPIAGVVANKAQKSFLFARVVSRRLADAEQPIDTQSPDWQGQLPTSLSEAFEQDLDRFPKNQRVTFFDLMVPLAYAQGRGLPWQNLWSRLASAIAKHEYTNHDIRDLTEGAGYYLIEDEEDGVSVYRLFHEEFAHYLRAATAHQDVERTIVETLIKMVPQDKTGVRWDRVYQPYLLAHLSTHATQIPGLLDTLIVDIQYLIRADPIRLLAAMEMTQRDTNRPNEAREFRDVYRLAQHHLRRTQNLDERAAYLELIAHEQQASHAIAAFRMLSSRNPWRVLWVRTRSMTPHQVIEGHSAMICAVALGERGDGQRVIVSGSMDQELRVWDLDTGAALLPPLIGHSGWVNAVALGVQSDGQHVIVSGGYDGTVRIWDLDTGAALLPPLIGRYSGMVNAVALGERSDGQRVIVCGYGDGLQLWNLDSGARLPLPPLECQNSWVKSVALGERSDGQRVIVCGCGDGTLLVWDLDTGAALPLPLVDRSGMAEAVALGKRGNGQHVIVSGCGDGTLLIRDLDSGARLPPLMSGHRSWVMAVALGEWSDGQRVIVSGSEDGALLVWDLDTGAALTLPLVGHSGAVAAVALGERKNGQRVIVSGSMDKTLRVWDLDTEATSHKVIEGHYYNMVTTIVVGERSGGQLVIVSGDDNGTVRIWDLDTGAALLPPLIGHSGWVTTVALGVRSDGQHVIVSGGYDGTVRIWDLDTGAALLPPLIGRYSGRVTTLALGERSDGQRVIVCGCEDGILLVWSLDTGAPLLPPLKGNYRDVKVVEVGERSDGQRVIVSGYGYEDGLQLWDLDSGARLPLPLECDSGVVYAVALGERSNGQRVIVLGGEDGLQLWDLDTGTTLLKGHVGWGVEVEAVALGKRGNGQRVIVSGSGNGTLCLWDLNTGTKLLPPLKGHSWGDMVVVLGERGNGQRVIVSGSGDRSLRVWDLDSGQSLMVVSGLTRVHAINLCRDILVIGTDSGLLALCI
jgi:WD40 repeat protein